MSKYLWLIDAGHGGIDSKGNYTTAPAKMYKHPNFTLYEGVTNRAIAEKLMKKLSDAGIDYRQIHEPIRDSSLRERVSKADDIYEKDRRAVYLSIHSNAGGGRGIEVFTSKGQTKSDKFAEVFYKTFDNVGKWKMRKDQSDGDNDKEAPFYVLRKTDCPALLVELLFFDNLDEAEYLRSDGGQEELSCILLDSISYCEQFV